MCQPFFVLDPALPVDAVSRLDSVSRSTVPFSHPTSLFSFFAELLVSCIPLGCCEVDHTIQEALRRGIKFGITTSFKLQLGLPQRLVKFSHRAHDASNRTHIVHSCIYLCSVQDPPHTFAGEGNDTDKHSRQVCLAAVPGLSLLTSPEV